MLNVLKNIFILAIGLSAITARADYPWDNLNQSEVDGIVEDFSVVFEHTTASPASSLGDLFGFEVGVLAGAASTPTIEKVVKEGDPGSASAYVPHLGLVGQVSVPFGVTFEAKILPDRENEADGITVGSRSGAIRWDISKIVPLPFSLAVKAHASNGYFRNEQVINNATTGNTDVDAVVRVDTSTMGLMLMASIKLLFIEPYAGIGLIKSDGEIKISTGSIFESGQSVATSETSGGTVVAGAQFHFLFFKPSIEYSRIFDSNKFTAKVAFGF